MDEQVRPRPRPRPRPAAGAAQADTPERPATGRATGPDVPGEIRSGGSSWRWWTAFGVLAAGLAAAVVWLVVLENREPLRQTQPSVNAQSGAYTPGHQVDANARAAVNATVAYLPGVLSYDYRSLAAGVASATKHMTPDFAAQFESMFTQTVEPAAIKNQAVVRTLIRAAGLASIDGNTASVLVFVDEALVSGGTGGTSSSGSGASGPKISQDRVHVDLIRSDGRWLFSNVTPF